PPDLQFSQALRLVTRRGRPQRGKPVGGAAVLLEHRELLLAGGARVVVEHDDRGLAGALGVVDPLEELLLIGGVDAVAEPHPNRRSLGQLDLLHVADPDLVELLRELVVPDRLVEVLCHSWVSLLWGNRGERTGSATSFPIRRRAG